MFYCGYFNDYLCFCAICYFKFGRKIRIIKNFDPIISIEDKEMYLVNKNRFFNFQEK